MKTRIPYLNLTSQRSVQISLLVALIFGLSDLLAQVSYQTHTLYIYSFAKYIQWPEEDRKGDFEIAVLGDSPILAELQKMAEKKKIGDRTIKISRFASLKELKKTHILFIPGEMSAQLAETLAKTTDQSTLVITEQAGMGAKGSGINFLVKEGKLVFEMNQSSLSKHKLKATNELSRMAINI